ncbi:MAG: GtrA family protein [Oscillospiraceae bacterium]
MQTDTAPESQVPAPDIFDRLMMLKPFRKLEPFYRSNKSVLMYLFFGGLTTVVGIGSFWFFADGVIGLNELIANVISWIFAVTFAFWTNRIWVFQSPVKTAREFLVQGVNFYAGRLLTLLIETAILGVFVTWLGFSEMPVKILAQVVVLVLNYIISKLYVFRKTKS